MASVANDTLRYLRGRERVLGNADLLERLDRIETTLLRVVERLDRLAEGLELGLEEARLASRADPEATALLIAKYPDVYGGQQEAEICGDPEADQ